MIEADLISGMHRFFYEFWSSHKLSNGCVLETDAQPKRLKSVLPHIVKIKNTQEGPKFSVVGTSVVDEYRQDFTRLFVREHPYEICREIYLSLIERMNNAPGLKSCFGQFCYDDRRLLRTMEMAFPLVDTIGEISAYLVLVTVDHSEYPDQLYFPSMPENVSNCFTDIGDKADFMALMQHYKNAAKKVAI